MGFKIDFESKQGKTRLNYVYSVGAAIVILGAMFKILHLPGGSVLIALGLLTEVGIFLVSAFEPQHEDIDWARVYPQLAPGADPSTFEKSKNGSGSLEASFSEKLDQMFIDAKLDLTKMESFGKGLQQFSKATDGLVKVVDANENAQSYSDQLAIAANHMSTLNTYYATHAEQTASQGEISQSFIDAAQSSAKYGEELSKAASQVESMNGLYSAQIENMNSQVSAGTEMVENISISVEDAKSMHVQVKELTENLSSLNNVYGGMLSAMNFNKQ